MTTAQRALPHLTYKSAKIDIHTERACVYHTLCLLLPIQADPTRKWEMDEENASLDFKPNIIFSASPLYTKTTFKERNRNASATLNVKCGNAQLKLPTLIHANQRALITRTTDWHLVLASFLGGQQRAHSMTETVGSGGPPPCTVTAAGLAQSLSRRAG